MIFVCCHIFSLFFNVILQCDRSFLITASSDSPKQSHEQTVYFHMNQLKGLLIDKRFYEIIVKPSASLTSVLLLKLVKSCYQPFSVASWLHIFHHTVWSFLSHWCQQKRTSKGFFGGLYWCCELCIFMYFSRFLIFFNSRICQSRCVSCFTIRWESLLTCNTSLKAKQKVCWILIIGIVILPLSVFHNLDTSAELCVCRGPVDQGFLYHVILFSTFWI